MTATTDILQPTPTRGSMKKLSEIQPEVAKCCSEPSEAQTGYPGTASGSSETATAPRGKASEGSETIAAHSGNASERSAGSADYMVILRSA